MEKQTQQIKTLGLVSPHLSRHLLSLFVLLTMIVVGNTKALADTALLTTENGWQKITALPAEANLGDYYFAFVDDSRDLMLSFEEGKKQSTEVGYKTMVYRTGERAEMNPNMLWELTKNSDGHSFKNSQSTLYMQCEQDGSGNPQPFYCRTHDVTGSGSGGWTWAKWTFVYADGKWTIQNGKYPEESTGVYRYIGPWDPANFIDGAEVAGNKTDANIGYFQIYAILKSRVNWQAWASTTNPANYTYKITNHDFECGADALNGWTNSGSKNFVLKDNNDELGKSGKNYIETYHVNGDMDINQTLAAMPAGRYILKAKAAAGQNGRLYINDSETEVTSTKNIYQVEYTLASAGNLKIGFKATDNNSSQWNAVDNFQLYYLGVAATSSTITFNNNTPVYTPNSSAGTFTLTEGNYNGSKNAVKMESTTVVTLTLTAPSTVTFNFAGTNSSIKINDVAQSCSDASPSFVLPAGTYTLKKDSGTKELTSISIVPLGAAASSECEMLFATAGASNTEKDTYTGERTGDTEWTVTIPYGVNGDTDSEKSYYIGYTLSSGASCSDNVKKSLGAAAGSTNQQAFTITAEDGTTRKTWTVRLVRANNPVTGITLDKSKVYLEHAFSEQLTATVAPADATNKDIIWTSSAMGTATVSSTGLVTAKSTSGGAATITATAADGSGQSASCDVYLYRYSETGTTSKEFVLGQDISGIHPQIYTVFTDEGGNLSLAMGDFSVTSSDPDVITGSVRSIQDGYKVVLNLTLGTKTGTATLSLVYHGSNANYDGKTCCLNYTVRNANIGNADCTDSYNSNTTSEAATLTEGQTVTFSFTNHNGGKGESWNNWNVVTGSTAKAGDGNATVLRSDAWFWGSGESGKHTNKSGDWSTMNQENMDGAQVEVKVTKVGNTVTYYAVMTLNDGTVAKEDLTFTYASAPTYAWLRVDNSYISDLDITTAAATYRTVTATTPNGNGTVVIKVKDTDVAVSSGGQVINGTTVTFTATPDSWYAFDNWHDGSSYVGDKTGVYTISVTSDLTMAATFNRYYQLTPVEENGTITMTSGSNLVTAETKIMKGNPIQVVATPADGYEFVKWQLDDVDKETTATWTAGKIEDFLNGVANTQRVVALTAVFQPIVVPETVAAPTFTVNEATVSGEANIETGQQVTITAEEGAVIHYVWASAVQSNYDSADNMIIAAGSYLKTSTSNVRNTSTSATGDRYLYAFAEKNGKYSSVAMVHFTATQPSNVKIWNYSEGVPTQNPDNGLSYDQTAAGDNGKGIKMNSDGYAHFQTEGEAGILTLVYGSRSNNGQSVLGVYAASDRASANEGNRLALTQTSVKGGMNIESFEIAASATHDILIKRENNNEGVLERIIWVPGVTANTVTTTATNGNVTIKNDDYYVNSGVKIIAGTELVFTATPRDADYVLTAWTDAAAGNAVSNNKFSATMGAADITVGAVFHSNKQASDLAAVEEKKSIAVPYGTDPKTLIKGTDYTTSSTGAITYSSSNDAVATVSNTGVITFTGAGTAVITLTQAADNTYLEGTTTFNVTVNRIDPTVTYPASIVHKTGQTIRTELVSNSDGAFTITVVSNGQKVASYLEGRTLVTTGMSEDNQRTSVTITQAASGNYAAKTFSITLDCQPAPVTITEVLEVRGSSTPAGGTFTNSTSTTNVKFDKGYDNGTEIKVDGKNVGEPVSATNISPLSNNKTSDVYATGTTNTISITLNSTSAKEIVIGLIPREKTTMINSVKVNGQIVTGYTTSSTWTEQSYVENKVERITLSGIDVPKGSTIQIDFTKSNGTSQNVYLYYFEVTNKSDIYPPVITDNGDATGTMRSTTVGVTYKYKAFSTRQDMVNLAVDGSWTESTGVTERMATTNDTWYVYAVAVKSAKQSDIAEGIIKVETTPTLSCSPIACVVRKNSAQEITTTAIMNKIDVTDQYTYSYSSNNSNATVSSQGVITGVSAGSSTITVTAKQSSTSVATATVYVVVTDDNLVAPAFTWNGDMEAENSQFDVEVGGTFSDKTPKAYKTTGEGEDIRYADITSGYDITYFSSNGNATVASDGKVTGVKVGTATIIAVFSPKGDYRGSYNGGIAEITANVIPAGTEALTVEVANNPDRIDLSSYVLTYQSAVASSVTAGAIAVSSANYRVAYESNNWNVATVDPVTGLVTAHNVGTAKITVAYVPINAFAEYKAFIHTYTITVVDPTRFVITEGYGGTELISPLTTVRDNNNYVTMTFGGWLGVNGTDTPVVEDGTSWGTAYNNGVKNYWGGKKDGGAKADAAGANPDYPYAITSKSGGNPQTEAITNYAPGSATQFSVPCRGAYIMFEPSVDGTITANILQNGVLDQADFADARSGRLVYIVDEFGNVVTPTSYGMASDVRNWKIGEDAQNGNKLTDEIYLKAIKAFQLGESIPTEGPHKPGNVEEVIPYNRGYAVLRKGPSFYTFKVKAGKKYYIFGNGTKNGFYGWQFRKDENFAPVSATISTENTAVPSSITINHRSMDVATAASLYDGKPVEITQYDRNFTAGIWQPLVLPYSMNDIQVKAIFGDDVDIVYVDDVDEATLKLSHHFYKTIVASKSCLIKPSKNVSSLATTNITKDGVAYPYVTFSNADITGFSDYTTEKKLSGYSWSPSYDPQLINGGDYYVNTKGEFSPLAKEKTAKLKGCRGFLRVTNPSLAKALNTFLSEFDTLLKGDVDCNGVVNMSDANMVIKYYLGERPEGFSQENADVNEDGKINMSDANGIVNIYLGITDNNE